MADAHTSQKWKVVGDAAKARAWCERYGLVIVRDIVDALEMPPEAAAGERLSTISWLRPPSTQPSVRRRAVR
jgi:hypothetical protein